MSNQDIATVVIVIVVVGLFTDFYGLGTLFSDRGKWYTVTQAELPIVMQNLLKLKAFCDSDGMLSKHVKMKAYPLNDIEVFYRIKVPHWVFKYEKIKLNDQKKLEMLGLGRFDGA